MTDTPDKFHRTLDAALERTDPSSPEAYAWPHVDISQHAEAVESMASLFAANQFAVRRLPEYDDSYLTAAQQQAFAEHYDEINQQAAQDEADDYLRSIGYVEADEIHSWGSGAPLKVILGVDQDPETAFVSTNVWQTPTTVTLEARHLDPEVLEILFGQPVVPLCDRDIPAEGQE